MGTGSPRVYARGRWAARIDRRLSLCMRLQRLLNISRPFMQKATLKETPTGPFGEEVPFGFLGGCIAIDTGEGGDKRREHLDRRQESAIYEFAPSGVFLAQLTGLATHSCAYDHVNEELYTAGKEKNGLPSITRQVRIPVTSIMPRKEQPQTDRRSVTGRSLKESRKFLPVRHQARKNICSGNELIGRPGENGGPAEKWSESVLREWQSTRAAGEVCLWAVGG